MMPMMRKNVFFQALRNGEGEGEYEDEDDTGFFGKKFMYSAHYHINTPSQIMGKSLAASASLLTQYVYLPCPFCSFVLYFSLSSYHTNTSPHVLAFNNTYAYN